MSDYISPTSGKSCSPAQYITEILCRREADKKKIVLPDKWWNTTTWKKKFHQNIIKVNSVLKLYDPQAILKALKRKECNWQWTILKDMHEIFRQEQEKIDKEKILIQNHKVDETIHKTVFEIKPKFGQQSKRNKLD